MCTLFSSKNLVFFALEPHNYLADAIFFISSLHFALELVYYVFFSLRFTLPSLRTSIHLITVIAGPLCIFIHIDSLTQ